MRVRRWLSAVTLSVLTGLAIIPSSPAQAAGAGGWIGTVTSSGSENVAHMSGPFSFVEEGASYAGTLSGVLTWNDFAGGDATFIGEGSGLSDLGAPITITINCTGTVVTVSVGLVVAVVHIHLECTVTITGPGFSITVRVCYDIHAFVAAGLIWVSAGASVTPC